VVDIGLEFPRPVRLSLKAAHARRVAGHWVSMWKHSPSARFYGQTVLRYAERRQGCDIVLQVQDLAALRGPYLVLQDLSYDVLLDEVDTHGTLTHFPSLSRDQVLRLRDRQRGIYQGAAGILAMSNWFARHLVAHSEVPADRVHVVHPGASASWLGDPPAARDPRGPRRRLLFVGKDFRTKGGEQVVGALAVLRAEVDPDITLTVVGPREWPLPGPTPPGVRFRGRLPVEALAAVYAEHDVFVMPSHFEGFGIALVEALALGLPCVARRAFAMPEIVRPGENGALAETDDPAELAAVLAEVLADDAMFDRTAAQAGEVRRYYSWDRAARDVLAVAKGITG